MSKINEFLGESSDATPPKRSVKDHRREAPLNEELILDNDVYDFSSKAANRLNVTQDCVLDFINCRVGEGINFVRACKKVCEIHGCSAQAMKHLEALCDRYGWLRLKEGLYDTEQDDSASKVDKMIDVYRKLSTMKLTSKRAICEWMDLFYSLKANVECDKQVVIALLEMLKAMQETLGEVCSVLDGEGEDEEDEEAEEEDEDEDEEDEDEEDEDEEDEDEEDEDEEDEDEEDEDEEDEFGGYLSCLGDDDSSEAEEESEEKEKRMAQPPAPAPAPMHTPPVKKVNVDVTAKAKTKDDGAGVNTPANGVDIAVNVRLEEVNSRGQVLSEAYQSHKSFSELIKASLTESRGLTGERLPIIYELPSSPSAIGNIETKIAGVGYDISIIPPFAPFKTASIRIECSDEEVNGPCKSVVWDMAKPFPLSTFCETIKDIKQLLEGK
jgi:hypothetical protein